MKGTQQPQGRALAQRDVGDVSRGTNARAWRRRLAETKWIVQSSLLLLGLTLVTLGVGSEPKDIILLAIGVAGLAASGVLHVRALRANERFLKEIATQVRKVPLFRQDLRVASQQTSQRLERLLTQGAAPSADMVQMAEEIEALRDSIDQHAKRFKSALADLIKPGTELKVNDLPAGSLPAEFGERWSLERDFAPMDSVPWQTDPEIRGENLDGLQYRLYVAASAELRERLGRVATLGGEAGEADIAIVSSASNGLPTGDADLARIVQFASQVRAQASRSVKLVFWDEDGSFEATQYEYISTKFDLVVHTADPAWEPSYAHLVCRELVDLRAIEAIAIGARSLSRETAGDLDQGTVAGPDLAARRSAASVLSDPHNLPVQEQLTLLARGEESERTRSSDLTTAVGNWFGFKGSPRGASVPDLYSEFEANRVYPTLLFVQKIYWALGIASTRMPLLTMYATVETEAEAEKVVERVSHPGYSIVSQLVLVVSDGVPKHLVTTYMRRFASKRTIVTSQHQLRDPSFSQAGLTAAPIAVVCRAAAIPDATWLRNAITTIEASVLPCAPAVDASGLSIVELADLPVVTSAMRAIRLLVRADSSSVVRLLG